MKKLIAMSVYGPKPMYVKGAVVNALMVPIVYPGWTLRIYCSSEVDVTQLKELGCEIVLMPRSRSHSGMFWRFLSAWDEDAERVIVRDSDSRLNVREAAAVKAWEESGVDAHCMMDHPHHSRMPMNGGMWGIKCRILDQDLHTHLRRQCRRRQPRVSDMKWLKDYLHPRVQGSLLRHSSVRTKWPSVPFPAHPPYDGFVGQQYNARNDPIGERV